MMLHIARQGGESAPVSLATVARQSSLSHGYLEQLALPLRTARLLRGVSGKGGGYQLARSADAITVREIFEAVLGPISIVECVECPEGCMRSDGCECRPLYVLLNRRITDAMESFTLADLLSAERLRALVGALECPDPGGDAAEGGSPDRVAPSTKA